MAIKFLDSNGVLYLWNKVKAAMPKKVSELTNDTGFITIDQVPTKVFPTATAPKMDGTATVGVEETFARGDHVHPSDTTKVDKVEGKGLSTNDYTTAEKNKLAGIEEGANKYTLPTATASILGGVKVGDNITNSAGVISVATATTAVKGVVQLSDAVDANLSTTGATSKAVKMAYDLANSKQSPATTLQGYGITDAYTKTEIDGMVSAGVHYKGTVATFAELPTAAVVGDMYNVTSADASHDVKAGDNVVWNGTSWDVLSGIVDLSNCVQASDVISNADIDAICAA